MLLDVHAATAAVEVRHEPAPGQRAFEWDRRCDPDIPADIVATATRMARGAALRGWGDPDDLLSAAHFGIALAVHRHAAAGHEGLPCRGSLVTYMKWQIRAVRSLAARKAAQRRPLPPKPAEPTPDVIADRREFWRVACDDLTERQAEMLRLTFRVGMSSLETGAALGISDQRVRYVVTQALPKVRESLLFAYGFQPHDVKGGAA